MATLSPSTPAPAGAPRPDICKLVINGTTPFMSGPDIRDDALRGAHALLHMLSAAFEDAGEINQHSGRETHSICDTLSNQIKADAMSGIALMIALAQFGSDVAMQEASDRNAAMLGSR